MQISHVSTRQASWYEKGQVIGGLTTSRVCVRVCVLCVCVVCVCVSVCVSVCV